MRTRAGLPLSLLLGLVIAGCGTGTEVASSGPTPAEAATPAGGPTASADTAMVQRVATPPVVRGLYVNRWAALGRRVWQLIEVAKTTEINALVIDVKDDRGLLLYRSRVPLARAIAADTVSPMAPAHLRELLDTLRANDIYPIARIVVAKDPLLARARLDWAIKRRSDLQPWIDRQGNPWLDPHRREVWRYAADIAVEAFDLGFSEIQFDYVRFPDERRLIREAAFPLARGRSRAQVIREQLAYTRGVLRPRAIRMAIDVFGLTATDSTDMGIGQRWEMFVDQADAVLPMNYPSHFARGTYGIANPNAQPGATIERAMQDVTRRTELIPGAGKIIPWYQDFTLGSPRYGVEQVRAQIEAGYANGYYDWMLWNPGSRYTVAAFRPKSVLAEDARRAAEDSVRRAHHAVARRDSLRADSVRRAALTADSARSP